MTLGCEPTEEVFIVRNRFKTILAVFTKEEDARTFVKVKPNIGRCKISRHELLHHICFALDYTTYSAIRDKEGL